MFVFLQFFLQCNYNQEQGDYIDSQVSEQMPDLKNSGRGAPHYYRSISINNNPIKTPYNNPLTASK